MLLLIRNLICRLNLKSNAELREDMAVSHKPNEFREVVKVLEEKFLPFHLGHSVYVDETTTQELQTDDEVSFNLNLPPWLCQPVNDLNILIRQRLYSMLPFSTSDWNRMNINVF